MKWMSRRNIAIHQMWDRAEAEGHFMDMCDQFSKTDAAGSVIAEVEFTRSQYPGVIIKGERVKTKGQIEAEVSNAMTRLKTFSSNNDKMMGKKTPVIYAHNILPRQILCI